MSRYAFAAAAALSVLFASSAAMAATANGSFTLSVIVANSCTVGGGGYVPLFGSGSLAAPPTVSALSALSNKTQDATMTVTCTVTTPYSVKLSSNTTTGFKLTGTISTNTIDYAVAFKSRSGGVTPGTGAVTSATLVTSRSVIGGTSKLGFSTSGSAAETLTFTFSTGTIASAAADTYTDQVNIAVEY